MMNKDGIKEENIIQNYTNKENRILRETNKKAMNISPKILDRTSLTHINKNTGCWREGFVEVNGLYLGQGTSRTGITYGNGNIPGGTWESQMERFDLDDGIKRFLTPLALGEGSEREFRIFSKDIQKKSRIQQSRATKVLIQQ